MNNNYLQELTKGFVKENPIFVQILGTCPTLAVTTAVINGISMGIATMFVLVCSNVMISLLSSLIPKQVRIAAYIVVISTFVTVTDLFLKANFIEISEALGPFIPLIVVNCIILGRAEAFACKNNALASLLDGIGMGIGFMISLLLISSVREIIGAGTWLGIPVMGQHYIPWLVMILPPGAFLVFGFLFAGIGELRRMYAR